MRANILVILGIILLTGVLRWHSWFIPFNRDEGGYAYVASQVFKPGFVLYQDAFEHKPPTIDFIYWLGFQLFGQTDTAIRTLSFLVSVITSYLFFKMTKQILPTFILVLFSNTFFLSGNGSNVEIFLSPLLLLGYWLILTKRVVLAGLVLGIAMTLKPVAITNIGVAYVLLPFFDQNFLVSRIRFTISWLFPVACLLAYEWSTGAFGDFVDAVVKFNTFYVSYGIERLPYGNNLFRIATFPDLVLIVAVFGTAILLWHNRRHLIHFWKPLLWALAIVGGAKILSREADHYYIPLLPAIGLVLLNMPRVGVNRLIKITLALYVVLHMRFLTYPPREAIISALDPGQFQIFEAREIGIRARSVAQPGDVGLVSLVAEPELLFYADLPSANRYFNTFAIDYYPDGRQVIIESLKKKPLVIMAYSGIIPEFDQMLLQLGYRLDPHPYFAPVYWRSDAAAKLAL